MKQHITVEQFNEIGIDKYVSTFLDKKTKDTLKTGNENWLKLILSTHFDIGKMIEVLKPKIANFNIAYEDISDSWWVEGSQAMDGLEFGSEELCDCLWEAVKYVLEVDYE